MKEQKIKAHFKLPHIDLLEQPKIKIGPADLIKNRPNSQFMEKILQDFGIDGKIKKINNGPVVSLYEFEPAPGVKVSRVINLSDDLARNTSSTSARVASLNGESLIRLDVENNEIVAKEIIFNDKIGRIRDFKIDYNGNIYLISDSPKSYLWKLSKIL